MSVPRPSRPARPRRARVRTSDRAPARASARAGFTIVEVLAAVFLLAVGLLAVAGLAAVAQRTTRRGTTQTLAAAIGQSRFDSLASLPCRTLAVNGATTGGATTRGVRERWRVTDGVNVKVLRDSLWVPGRHTPVVHVSVIPCRD